MQRTGTPGVIANLGRKNGRSRDGRKMAGLDRACGIVGGQELLADSLGVSARLLRKKMAAEAPIHAADLRRAADAVTARARTADDLAKFLVGLIGEDA